MMRSICLTCLLCLSALLAPAAAAEPDAKGIEFFEKKIRPVLVEQCYKCHSAEAQKNKKLRGGLFLDSRAGVLKGGDSGPALVPGKPAEGTLLPTLRYTDDIRMPPRGKLADAVLADFETWVKMGAPDPRTATIAKGRTINIEEGRKFWAYQPPRSQQPPLVKDTRWPAGPIDRFILAGLEAKGLRPAADADRATLTRRLSFDLVGLPPTPEEIDAFVNDPAPDAYEKLVDRLLASPHFGERWGRHWLDVARFAESVTLRGFIFKESWRYRDYVIDAFNRDLPYDRFLQEQIAGDLLPASTLDDRRRQLSAVTFLSLGNTNLEEQDKKQLRMDVVDEQLDTISKAVLAQTITCARCHDHKFDPIPTRDYYALAGILRNTKTLEHANVSRWLEMPLPADPQTEADTRKHEQAVAALEAKLKTLKDALARSKPPLNPARPKILAVKDVPGIVLDDTQAKKVGEWKESKYSGSYVGNGYIHDLDQGKGEKTLTFLPELPRAGRYEVRLAYSPGSNRAESVPVTVLSADGEKVVHVNQKETPPIDGLFVSLGRYQFERNGQNYVLISNEGTKGHVIVDAVVFLPADKMEEASGSVAPRPPVANATDSPGADAIRKLETELKQLKAQAPRRDMVMTVQEEKTIEDSRIHIRGLVQNLGETAPRGFLQVATTGPMATLPANESGRRQLAAWLASKDNPLTARVLVNRAWHWLFGVGLVRTVDNFGTTGERPSHPELLDDLAVRFVEGGWSVKKLVREIVLSRTYRLGALRQGEPVDPENQLFGRANRRRLEAECIRDTILAVSGQLQLDRGGPTYKANLNADYGFKHADTRRGVYAPVFRNSLPELFEVFDFADPSMVVGRRNVSTVAPQALFLINHPFVIEQSRHAANRLLAEKSADELSRIVQAHRLTLGRPPSDGELRLASKFLEQASRDGKTPREAWGLLFQALFGSMDFRYVK